MGAIPKTTRRAIAYAVVLALGLGACKSKSAPTPNLTLNTSTPTASPPNPDIHQRLMVVRGDTLYLAHFDGTAPSVIAEGVRPKPIYLSRAHPTLMYVSQGNQWVVYDWLAAQARPVLTLESDALYSFGWSPNQQWMALVMMAPTNPDLPLTAEQRALLTNGQLHKVPSVMGVYADTMLILVGADATTQVMAAYPVAVEWLADNRLLVSALPYGELQSYEDSLIVIDPNA